MQKSKGFTIIELLVVVAIIAVLTGIVLVNVTQYINKSKDAAIKGSLSSGLTNAAVYYAPLGTYIGFAATSGWTTVSAGITAAGGTGIVTHESATGWCACSQEKVVTTTNYCVDSTGNKKETVSQVCGTATCISTAAPTCV